MTAPLSIVDLVWIRLIADANTPADVRQYHNKEIGLPSAALAGMGSSDQNPGVLAGIWGWRRDPVTPGVAAEWVMAPRIPAPTVTQFMTIPGPEGWIRPESRQAFQGIGVTMINDLNVPPGDAVQALRDLYQAAIAEGVARRQAGLSLHGATLPISAGPAG